MKQLLEQTKLTAPMAAKLGSTTTRVGTAAPAVQPSKARQKLTTFCSRRPTLAQLFKRPEITIESLSKSCATHLRNFSPSDSSVYPMTSVNLSSEIRNELKSVETEIKYAGYLQQQQRSIERLKKAEQRAIPDWFDYREVSGLSREMQEKLLKIRPRTLGHASRIPG